MKQSNLMIASILAIGLAATSIHAADNPAQPPYSWQGINGQGVYPAGDLVTEFWDLASDIVTNAPKGQPLNLPGQPGEKKNIVWRVLLPHWGMNAPIVVGDRVFLMCDDGWQNDAPLLLCYAAQDGKELWRQEVDHLDAWPPDKQPAARELRKKHLEYWRAGMRAWNRVLWDNEHNTWAKSRWEALSEEETEAKLRAIQDETGFWFGGRNNKPTFGGQAGGFRGRMYWYGDRRMEEMKATYEAVAKQGIHSMPGWTGEGPFFGNTMGSLVSDGKTIFALTAHGALAAYDLDGNRRWITTFEVDSIHREMSSPVLVGDTIIYHHWAGAKMMGWDAATGQLRWTAEYPLAADESEGVWQRRGPAPRGYRYHMQPAATPVVMILPDDGKPTAVAVAGHGVVVRIRDGHVLGQVYLPKGTPVLKKKSREGETEPAPSDIYTTDGYANGVANGDTFYWSPYHYGLYAIKLGIDGDRLQQKIAWRAPGGVMLQGNGPKGMTYFDGRVYIDTRGTVTALDAVTGEVKATGPCGLSQGRGLGFTPRQYTVVNQIYGDKTEAKFDPANLPGHGSVGLITVSVPDLKPLGRGFLAPPAPDKELTERHIAMMGTPRLIWGVSTETAWGNRIFIRNNDYLWCIGDPEKDWVPPEKYLK